MDITVLDTGFVTGDFLKPLGYAGEMNSRKVYVVHPHFKDCYYQLLVQRYDGLYRVGIDDGEAMVPPSLLRAATDLKCQCVAISDPDSVENAETDTFLFESEPFTLKVKEGLNQPYYSAVPPYEELQRMYKNLDDARNAVDLAKKENEAILAAIEEALRKSHEEPVAELSEQILSEYRKQLEGVCQDYMNNGFLDDVANEVANRLTSRCECGEVGKMTTEQLTAFIQSIIGEMKTEVINGEATWLSQTHHSMSSDGSIIGG